MADCSVTKTDLVNWVRCFCSRPSGHAGAHYGLVIDLDALSQVKRC